MYFLYFNVKWPVLPSDCEFSAADETVVYEPQFFAPTFNIGYLPDCSKNHLFLH